jgi:hypothetical protein
MTEHPVTLPSGAVFLLRKPTLSYRMTHFTAYQSVAARLSNPQAGAVNADTDTKQLVQLYYDVLCECCVKPRISLAPQEGELHPEQIQMRDALFIARWAGGEIDPASGTDLAEFRADRPGQAAATVSSAGSADVVLPPVPDYRPPAWSTARDGNPD